MWWFCVHRHCSTEKDFDVKVPSVKAPNLTLWHVKALHFKLANLKAHKTKQNTSRFQLPRGYMSMPPWDWEGFLADSSKFKDSRWTKSWCGGSQGPRYRFPQRRVPNDKVLNAKAPTKWFSIQKFPMRTSQFAWLALGDIGWAYLLDYSLKVHCSTRRWPAQIDLERAIFKTVPFYGDVGSMIAVYVAVRIGC